MQRQQTEAIASSTTHLIALIYILPLTARDFTRILWQSATECPVVFPGGVGVVPWMVPGGAEIAMATSELMKEYDAAVWTHHGLFCSGPDFDTTFGLITPSKRRRDCGSGVERGTGQNPSNNYR